MIRNVIVKNAEFSINGIKDQTELSSAVMSGTDIFGLPACRDSSPDYKNISVICADSLAEYFEQAENILEKEKECVLLHEFEEGFISFTITSDLNSSGYAVLSADMDNSASDISLKDAFYKILLSVLEVRYYMDFDTEKYRNLVFADFPYRRTVKANGVITELTETENQIVLPFKSDYMLVALSFSDEHNLTEKLLKLREKTKTSTFNELSELSLAELDNRKSDEKTIVFCVKDSEMLCEQIDMVSSQRENFLKTGFTWKTPSGSFFVNTENPAKIAFCNPPAGMYSRESFFRLYTKLNGVLRSEEFSSYNVIKSENDMSNRYLYDAINTYVLIRILSSAGITADYLSGGSMGEISYSINKKIIKSRSKNITEVFEIIKSVLSDMLARQYDLAEKYYGRKVDEWTKYYVQCDAEKLQEIISEYDNAFIIIKGSPKDVMVCGEESACSVIFNRLKCVAVKLDEPIFIHTPVLGLERENIIKQFVSEGIYADSSDYSSELFSTASCRTYVPDPEWFAENMANILTDPVNYPEAVRKMYDLGTRIFIDISTGQICRKWVSETLFDKDDTVIMSVYSKENDCTDLVRLAAKLISYRTKFDHRKFFGMFGYDIQKTEKSVVKKEEHVPSKISVCSRSSETEKLIERQLENNVKAYRIYTECQNQIYRKLLMSMNSGLVPEKNCIYDRAEILEMTDGSLAAVLGEKYREADSYPVRARMPLPPFLFADRIIKIDAEFGKLRPSEIVTEYDIPSDCVFRTGENSVSALVMSESAHVGVFLMSYIGIDIVSKGTLAFRAVDTSQRVVSDRNPCVGDTMKTVFRIDRFMKNGSTTLLFYTCENYLNDELIAVNTSTGGFFTSEDLSSSSGIIEKDKEIKAAAGKTFYHTATPEKSTFEKEDMLCFYQADYSRCFGKNADVKTAEKYIIASDMQMIDRIADIDFDGGKYSSGYIRAEKKITPDMWFFDAHFKNDPVLPATASISGAEQMMMFLYAYSGLLGIFENCTVRKIPGNVQKSKFRGQIRRKESLSVYECHIKEVIKTEDSVTLVYDTEVYNDGIKIMKLENNMVCISGR